jgi:hypothetical protein
LNHIKSLHELVEERRERVAAEVQQKILADWNKHRCTGRSA